MTVKHQKAQIHLYEVKKHLSEFKTPFSSNKYESKIVHRRGFDFNDPAHILNIWILSACASYKSYVTAFTWGDRNLLYKTKSFGSSCQVQNKNFHIGGLDYTSATHFLLGCISERVHFRCYLNKDWGCVILREIDFLLKICWSIPCLHQSWKVHHFFMSAQWLPASHKADVKEYTEENCYASRKSFSSRWGINLCHTLQKCHRN